MAVLKSLELNGNKQSFASWISNLSPCETPFASMIGKDSISQAQYSWQVDSLAPPAHSGYDEGSNVEFPVRRGTDILHNYTSTLRKVVNISDTAERIALHGRASEMNYQMSKAGKELMRDIEFMCLNNKRGNAGTKDVASKFSGFYGLCTGPDFVDPDTGAKTIKKVSVADVNGPWFKPSDLFDLTYNLYLAGSKANKIMFHPRHALTFSRFMSGNIESPHTYRMFDGLDDKFNMKVSSIRDPLSQKYDLISNRFMPEDMIYIFNEADWTQTILRQPAVSPLGRKGSAERYLMETEIGLRHRNPQASGVLVVEPSSLLITWTAKPTPLTWGVGNQEEAGVNIKVRSTGQNVDDGTVVNWASSNPAVVSVADPTGHTADGNAVVLLNPLRAGTSVITASNADGHASYLVTVGNPNVRLTLSNNLVEKGKGVLAVVKVTKADGTPVRDGTVVNFTADPAHLVNLPAKSGVTSNGTGVTQIEVNAAQTLGLVQVQASTDTSFSNRAKLEIVEKVEELIMRIDQRVIAHGINDSSVMEIMVVDSAGSPIHNQPVTILSTDSTVIQIHNTPISTGGTGVYSTRLTATGFGQAEIVAQYKGQQVSLLMKVTPPNILLVAPATAKVGTPFSMTATVTRSDDTLVSGVDVSFKSTPPFSPLVPDTATDAKGVASVLHTELNNSDLEVNAIVGNYKSNTCDIAVSV